MPAPAALCPVCDKTAPVDAAACPTCGGSLQLHERYTLERLLGAGGQSRVFAARDGRDGTLVAVKIMSLARVHDWKSVELFRRSAGVLAGLDHPAIPKLTEYFEETRSGAALYCLVHEFIEGETLAEAQKRGERFDEAAVRGIARELLTVLDYLHGVSPPIIHRDIKPSNLMRRRGQLVLIDFDLVRDVLRPEGGSTMSAGTPGYTPIEQYAGDATPATDLYAVGATLAALLSRKSPLEMRGKGEQRIAVRAHVRVGEQLLRVLERLLEPEARRRYQSAAEVLADLDRDPAPAATPSPRSSSRTMVAIAVGGVAIAVASAAHLALREPATIATPPPPPPIAIERPPPKKPPPPVAAKPELASGLAREQVLKTLTAGPWEGRADTTRIRLTFTGDLKRPQGHLFTLDARGAPGAAQKLGVEITDIGTLVLRLRTVEDGVSVDQTYFGDLTRDLHSIVGARETRYFSAGSGYATEHPWSVERTSAGR